MQKSQHDHIFNLQVQGDKYARLLINQKQRISKLDAQLTAVREQVKHFRQRRKEADRRGGGMNAVKSCLASEQKEIRILENRLAACKTRESKMISYNNDLKRKVNDLRATRVLSNTIFEKHQKRLKDVQKQMQATFEASNELMSERDSVMSQVLSLNVESQREQEGFDETYAKLTAIVQKEKETATEYRKAALQMDPMDNSAGYVRGAMTMQEEENIKEKLQQLERKLDAERANIESTTEKLASYKDTLQNLQTIFNVDEYSKLVDVFNRGEEETFATYRYIQGINNEIEQIQEQVALLDQEKEAFSKEINEGSAHTRKRLLETLEESKNALDIETLTFNANRSNLLLSFHPIAKAVDKLFASLGCSETVQSSSPTKKGGRGDKGGGGTGGSAADEMLAQHGVTEGNILQFLAIIENRSNDIIQQFNRRDLSSKADGKVLGGHLKPGGDRQQAIGGTIRTLLPDPRAHGGGGGEDESYASDDDDHERPLSKAELRARAANSVSTAQIAQAQQKAMHKHQQPRKKQR